MLFFLENIYNLHNKKYRNNELEELGGIGILKINLKLKNIINYIILFYKINMHSKFYN